jgi:aquaporin Z
MSSQPSGPAPQSDPDRQQTVRHAEVALRSMEQPNSAASEFEFWNDRCEGRRLFSPLDTFFPVLVTVGAGVVDARVGGHAVPSGARVVASALIVTAIVFFIGTVSCAHLNPVVRSPWRRATRDVVWTGHEQQDVRGRRHGACVRRA